MSVLFQATLVLENKKTVNKTVLLNVDRVGEDFHEISGGRVLFHYDLRDDRREKNNEYVYNGRLNEFKALLAEGGGNDQISISRQGNIPIEIRYPHKRYWKDFDYETVVIRTNHIIWAENVSNDTRSVLCCARGAFEKIWYKLPYTIDEIDKSGSGSGSMAFA